MSSTPNDIALTITAALRDQVSPTAPKVVESVKQIEKATTDAAKAAAPMADAFVKGATAIAARIEQVAKAVDEKLTPIGDRVAVAASAGLAKVEAAAQQVAAKVGTSATSISAQVQPATEKAATVSVASLGRIGTAAAALEQRLNLFSQRVASTTGTALARIGSVATAVDARITSLTGGRLTQALAGIASISAAKASIDAAGEADASERRLTTALGENNALLSDRLELADKLSASSIFDNDAIVEAEVRLRNLGATQLNIDKLLAASMALASARGIGLAEAAEQIAKSLDGTSGRLAQLVPGLEVLTEAQLRAGGAADVIISRFGEATRVVADSPFGQRAQLSNKLGDQIEAIGKALVVIENRLKQAVLPLITRFADYLNSPRGTAFLDAIATGLEKIVAYAVPLAAVLATLKAIAVVNTVLGVSSLVTSATSLALAGTKLGTALLTVRILLGTVVTQAAALAGTLLVIAAVVLEIGRALGLWKEGVAGTVGLMGDVLKSLGDGALKADELWRSFIDGAQRGWLSVRYYITLAQNLIGEVLKYFRAQFTVTIDEITKLMPERLQKLLGITKQASEAQAKALADAQIRVARGLSGIDVSGAQVTALKEYDDALAEIERDRNRRVREQADLYAADDLKKQREANEAKRGASAAALRAEIDDARAARIAQARADLSAIGSLYVQRKDINQKYLEEERRQEVAALDRLLDEKKISIAAYAEQRRKIELKPLAEEIAKIEQQITSASGNVLGNVFSGGSSVADLTAIKKLNADLAELLLKRKQIEGDITDEVTRRTEEQRKDSVAVQQKLAEAQAELAARQALATGDKDTAELIRLQAAHQRELSQLREDGMASYIPQLQQVQAAELAAVRAREGNEQIDKQAKRAIDDLNDAAKDRQRNIKEITALVQSGSLTQRTASELNVKQQQVFTEKVKATIAVLEELKAKASDPEIRRQMDEYIEDARRKGDEEKKKAADTFEALIDQNTQFSEDMGKRLTQNFLQSPLEGFFQRVITSAQSAKEAFRNFALDVANQLAALAAKLLANQLLVSLFGGQANGGQAIAGAVVTRNSGGPIPGAGPDRDSVPALLTPGEYVIRRSAARLHARLLDFINRHGAGLTSGELVQRLHSLAGQLSIGSPPMPQLRGPVALNAGGLVPAAARAAAAAPTAAYVVADDETCRRLIKGGEPYILDLIRRNRASLNLNG